VRVRVNSLYFYDPVFLDRQANLPINKGDIVRVVNLNGCPPANTMGQCYVADPDTNHFIGMVCCNSLEPVTPADLTLAETLVRVARVSRRDIEKKNRR
jgi:hypothetical protein